MDIKYRYFGDTSNSKGVGKIVVAYNETHYGLSFCNPNDCYKKLLGKEIAKGRLLKTPQPLPKSKMTYADWIDLFLSNDQSPSWIFKGG